MLNFHLYREHLTRKGFHPLNRETIFMPLQGNNSFAIFLYAFGNVDFISFNFFLFPGVQSCNNNLFSDIQENAYIYVLPLGYINLNCNPKCRSTYLPTDHVGFMAWSSHAHSYLGQEFGTNIEG